MAKRTHKITQHAQRRGGSRASYYGIFPGNVWPVEHRAIAGITAATLHDNNSMKLHRLNNK